MSGAPGGPAIQRQHDHETAKHRELGGGTTPGEEGVVAWEAQAEPRPQIPVLPFKRRQGRLTVEPCHPRLHPPRLHLHGSAQALAPDTDQCSGTVTLPQICPAPQPHFSLPPTCLEPEEVAPPLSPPLLKSGMTSQTPIHLCYRFQKAPLHGSGVVRMGSSASGSSPLHPEQECPPRAPPLPPG